MIVPLPVEKDAQIAIHTAGHAVACYAFGIPIGSVSILAEPSKGFIAHPEFSPDLDPQDTLGRIDSYIKDFSGYASEQLAGYSDIDGWMHDVRDYKLSMLILTQAGGVSVGAEKEYEKWLMEQANILMQENWTAVKRFAEVLIEKRRLGGQEAEELCRKLAVRQRDPKAVDQVWTLP